MLQRRGFLSIGLAGLAVAATARHAAAADPAVALIERFYDSILAAMKRSGGQTVAARAQVLSGPVNSTFDIGVMTRLAVGPSWSSIAGGQQSAIQQGFGRFLVATYAKQIKGYSGERFEVSPGVEQRRIGKLVRSRIIEGGGQSTMIDYVVGGSGRAIDVYLNGAVSELASRRAEFESILASGGASALLQSLQQRTERLLAG